MPAVLYGPMELSGGVLLRSMSRPTRRYLKHDASCSSAWAKGAIWGVLPRSMCGPTRRYSKMWCQLFVWAHTASNNLLASCPVWAPGSYLRECCSKVYMFQPTRRYLRCFAGTIWGVLLISKMWRQLFFMSSGSCLKNTAQGLCGGPA